MPGSADRPPWVALTTPSIEPRPKRVVESADFYLGKPLTDREIGDLKLIRGLIAAGGDLQPFYRRSTRADTLLLTHGVLHLHLGGRGSDTLLT